MYIYIIFYIFSCIYFLFIFSNDLKDFYEKYKNRDFELEK